MRCVLGILTLAALAITTPVDAQSVRGRLVDAQTGAAVERGTMTLLSEDSVALQSRVTDAEGAFALSIPGPGAYRLGAERIGYRTAATPLIELEEADSLEVEFRLSVDAVLLQPLDVVVHNRRPPGPLGGFYERMERGGFGTFISRDEIEERKPLRTSDLLQTVPGVQLVRTRWGETVALMRGRCAPQVYMDGMRLGVSSVDLVHPMDLEGIEVYRGPAGVPGEFSHRSGCGAIALWTRRGPSPPPP
jgi:hypothetical protein